MKNNRALFGFILLTIFYLSGLIWVDTNNEVFSKISLLVNILPALIGISFFSFLVRYLRWQWLLRRAGHTVSLGYGFLAYLAGFAFTATPGKVGELIRIRYFGKANVPASISFGAFIFERALDLIVVLFLASLVASHEEYFIFAVSFVLIFLVLVVLLTFNVALLNRVGIYAHSLGWNRLGKLMLVVQNGLSACRFWFKPLDLLISFLCGLAAWSLTAFGFLLLTQNLGIAIDPLIIFAIYPLAMLVGAASMLPSGVGSTELTILMLLGFYGVTLGVATLTAIGIRLATIWFAMLIGLISVTFLEYNFVKIKD